MTNLWNKVILFGDSLTQRGFEPLNGCWAAMLGHRLQRISDVTVRGFSGYNSRWLRIIVPKVFPKDMNVSDISCLTILIGANDANDADSPTQQFVPIDEYESNLNEMINYFESIGITRNAIILISPPNYCHKSHSQFCRQTGRPEPKKDNQTVGKYAKACRRAAQTSRVEFIDLYEEFSNHQNSEELLCDGLHFSYKGSQLLFELILPLIEKRVKIHKQCNELTINFANYSDIDTNCPQKSLLE